MKNRFLLLLCSVSHLMVHGQRFFYVEPNHLTDLAIHADLLKATQYITKSPLYSDYIITTDVAYGKESDKLKMKITVQDSVTLKTICQINEEQILASANAHARIIIGSTLRFFIDRNIARIIDCARQNHDQTQWLPLKARKDKT